MYSFLLNASVENSPYINTSLSNYGLISFTVDVKFYEWNRHQEKLVD